MIAPCGYSVNIKVTTLCNYFLKCFRMSREISPFGLRMPPDLKSQIEASSKSAGRSMNAEIVHRLELTLSEQASLISEKLTAEQANRMAENARENLLASSKKECIKLINQAAAKGINRADFDFIEFAGLPDNVDLNEKEPLYQKLVIPLVSYLAELGYQVEVDGNDLFIDF